MKAILLMAACRMVGTPFECHTITLHAPTLNACYQAQADASQIARELGYTIHMGACFNEVK